MRINVQALYQQKNFFTNIGCYLGYLYKKKFFFVIIKNFFLLGRLWDTFTKKKLLTTIKKHLQNYKKHLFAWTTLGHFYKKKNSLHNYKRIFFATIKKLSLQLQKNFLYNYTKFSS